MCRAFEELKEETKIDIAKRLIEYGKMTLEEVARVTELPINTITELAHV